MSPQSSANQAVQNDLTRHTLYCIEVFIHTVNLCSGLHMTEKEDDDDDDDGCHLGE